MKFKARGASILALFPTACHPSGDLYVCPPRFPSLGNNPEMKSLCFLRFSFPLGLPYMTPLFTKTLSANCSQQGDVVGPRTFFTDLFSPLPLTSLEKWVLKGQRAWQGHRGPPCHIKGWF